MEFEPRCSNDSNFPAGEPEDIADDLQPIGAVCHLSSLPWKEAREQYLASLSSLTPKPC